MYLQTYTGKKFEFDYINKPWGALYAGFDIVDIAHSLSNICRFNGHCKQFYSVAQHSLLSSHYCEKYPLTALLHDAAEAYLGDISKPLQSSLNLSNFKALENVMLNDILWFFGNDSDVTGLPQDVKEVDLRMLATEKRDLMFDHGPWETLRGYEPYSEIIEPMTPREAKQAFLARYKELHLRK